ncbi:MAG: hypothetical protein ACREXG_00555 [Polaromonas sp.]
MAKVDSSIYLKSSNQDDEVLLFGKSPEQEAEDLRNGVARFGGDWRQPSYARAYLRAARVLIHEAQEKKDLDQLGLPIFYLQRHALELFLKQLLGLLYDVAKMRFELYQSKEAKKNLPSKNALERLATSHSLLALNADLQDASAKLQIEGYPSELQSLINDIQKYEINPTWSRYPSSAGAAGVNVHLKSEVAVPLVEMHQRLESVVQKTAFDVDQETETFERSIYDEWNSLMQSLENECG